MTNKIYPSYTDIHNEVIEYANIIKENNVKFDAIIALARGGSLIGTILSHALDVPLRVVTYSSKYGQGETKHAIAGQLPAFDFSARHILIVDDICDSGYTFKEVVEYYETRRYFASSYAVYYRNTESSIHHPNYSIELMGNEWIVFPWENDNLLPNKQVHYSLELQNSGWIHHEESWPESVSYT